MKNLRQTDDIDLDIDVDGNSDINVEKYRSLIKKRDRLRKESQLYLHEYIRTFGELLEENYTLKIQCIRCKKIISYCLAKMNNGCRVYRDELEDHIDTVMHEYYEELKAFSDVVNAKTKSISQYDLHKIKKLYYQIVNMIHPDLHPKLFESEEIQQLWEKAKDAYERNDYTALKEAEILLVSAVKQLGGEERKIEVENIDGKITLIRMEIDEIINNDPYMYKYLLEDDEAVTERKNELRQQNEEYEEYLEELRLEVAKFEIEEA